MSQERGNHYRGKKAGESGSQEHHGQLGNTQEETMAELTQEKTGGYKKPIEIRHAAEEGVEQANLIEGIPRKQLDGSQT